MSIILGLIFDQDFTWTAFKGIICATVATFIGRAFFQFIPIVGAIVSALVAAIVTEGVGWLIAVDMAKSFRKEWECQKNAKEAADAYAEAEYYKKTLENDDTEAEEFGDD